MEPRLTDLAGMLHFASHGTDPVVTGMSVSVETSESLCDGPAAENLLLEVFAAGPVEAALFAQQHALTPAPHLAARLRRGTQMWTGWISRATTSTPVRCVLYAPGPSSRTDS
ncbi:hypothetical protein [Antribacter gilvus]|uniref:hypothetical protein n=1 Tax=Antribacter gilvus TaxID=2304675 RepID=UPI000F7AC366|nr:hypothetical protein [Antribacter gilvus]